MTPTPPPPNEILGHAASVAVPGDPRPTITKREATLMEMAAGERAAAAKLDPHDPRDVAAVLLGSFAGRTTEIHGTAFQTTTSGIYFLDAKLTELANAEDRNPLNDEMVAISARGYLYAHARTAADYLLSERTEALAGYLAHVREFFFDWPVECISALGAWLVHEQGRFQRARTPDLAPPTPTPALTTHPEEPPATEAKSDGSSR